MSAPSRPVHAAPQMPRRAAALLDTPGLESVKEWQQAVLAAAEPASDGDVGATRDERTERTVDPMRLLFVDGRWYLEAWCRRAEGMRLFRLDRVDDVEVLDEPAAPPPQAHERDVENGVYQPEPGSPVVRLRLARSARWLADYYPVEQVTPTDDPPGGLAVAVRTADLAWARRLVASLGGAAVVDEPAELATQVAADARAALRRYGIDAGTDPGAR